MKKLGAFVLILILLIISLNLVVADANETCDDLIQNQNETDVDCGGECSACIVAPQQNASKIENAFACLESKVAGKCSSLSVEEISLTLLASPSSIIDDCTAALKAKMSTDGSWSQNIKDTALAVLALNHVGETTAKSEIWLLNQNKTPTDLIWYLEQDSEGQTQCKISYDSQDFIININANKKIDSRAGNCLSLAQSNFWLQIASDCLNKEFVVACDQKFIATLLYKQQNSPTIYVLPDTKAGPASGSVSVKVNSKCFGSSSCSYEDSAWATFALLETGHEVSMFIPYLIAASDSNERYVPFSFLYLITNYPEYATGLIEEQELGNYWQAPSTPYNKFYDTALAILALSGSSTEQVIKARDWLLFQQSSDGCWKNSNSEIIRDTAFVLWALEKRTGTTTDGGVTYCSEANFFCVLDTDCPTAEKLENYFCPGLSTVCCQNQNLKSCEENSGEICTSEEFCSSDEIQSTEGLCCLGTCEIRTTTSACETVGYICKSECSETQETIDYACDGGDVCCKTKTTTEGGSLWWLWILIILIILVVLAIIFREKLKMFWYKIRGGGKKGPDSTTSSSPPGMPPRPGFPPIRRMPFAPQPRQMIQRRTPMDDTFEKLKKMTGGK